MKKLNISKDDIIELYINQNLPQTEVASRLNISIAVLKSRLRTFGIVKSKEAHLANIANACQAKYGCSNAGGLKSSQDKARATNLARYGTEWAMQSVECKERLVSSVRESRGVDNVFASADVKAKIRDTMQREHGVSHNMQLADCKAKARETSLSKYGVEHYAKTDEFKERTRNTCLTKYGVDSFSKTDAFKAQYDDAEYNAMRNDKIFETKKKNGTLAHSKFELEIVAFLNSIGVEGDKYIKGKGETRFEVDYLCDNIGIEANGSWWHSIDAQDHKPKAYHYNKMRAAEEMGIDLIQIWEDQWTLKKDIIQSILRNRFGLNDTRIYARKCEVREIDNATYKAFCIATHIQGYRAAKVRLGLFHDNTLVQVASFNKCAAYGKRGNKYQWEWIRGCIASNNSVVGGTSKLLKHFIAHYDPESILCYADANLFSGEGYVKAGFAFTGYTGPDKFFIENNTAKRFARNPYKYREFKEGVKTGKYFECYGAGSRRYVWHKVI